MSREAACLLARWCPVESGREPDLGSCTERVNLGRDTDHRPWVMAKREPSKRQEPRGVEYRGAAQGRIAP